MAHLDNVLTLCDQIIDMYWPRVLARQETWKTVRGKYWQGLPTHSTIPNDGQFVMPDVGESVPTDQPDTWPVDELVPLPFSLQMHSWRDNGHIGFTAIFSVVVDGKLWCKALSSSDKRNLPWHEVVND